MPPELHERVKAAALASNRSMNSEIISRLEATFTDTDIAAIVKAAVKEALEEASHVHQ
jgi:SpoVK/Ycf46/Vps4 family AAA+-type ATPase